MTDRTTEAAPKASLAAQAETLAQDVTGEVIRYLIAVDKELGLPAKCDGVKAIILAALRRVQTERQQTPSVAELDARIAGAYDAGRRDALLKAADDLPAAQLRGHQVCGWLRQRAEDV